MMSGKCSHIGAWLTLLTLASWSLTTQAHLVGSADHGESFSVWSVDPVAVSLLLLVAVIYARGARRFGRRALATQQAFKRRQLYFWLGWIALALALLPPLDPLGEVLFSAHMVQHETMMLIAGPLLVMSRPGSALLRGMGRSIARVFGSFTRQGRSFWSTLISPMGAWCIHALGLWGWHVPALFNAGLSNNGIHALQHLSFLLISLIFWYALLRPRRYNSGFGVIYLFTTALHTSLLGALLTFSPRIWYSPYAMTAPQWGFSPLEDQQLGGLIMWVPGGVVFVVAGLLALAKLTHASDEHFDYTAQRAMRVDHASRSDQVMAEDKR